MKTDKMQKVYKAIEAALELPNDAITAESNTENTSGWDSIGHLSILAALDELFDGKIADIQEFGLASSVKEIAKILEDNSLI